MTDDSSDPERDVPMDFGDDKTGRIRRALLPEIRTLGDRLSVHIDKDDARAEKNERRWSWVLGFGAALTLIGGGVGLGVAWLVSSTMQSRTDSAVHEEQIEDVRTEVADHSQRLRDLEKGRGGT